RMSSAGTDITYFPAYEIMVDDLRDYRFYANDMIHPSEVAGDYIWEKFSNAYFSKATQEIIATLKDLSKALQHRPFHPESAGHKQFLRDVHNKLKFLSTQIDVSEELQSLESQLNQS
ncbi:MAG TPA: GSCFA domain-containing protein, partial [Cyclobacteriaceae bacterium]|nr:GSCFA domain-containing protein [Cyclobacteriaceae bacterium]